MSAHTIVAIIAARKGSTRLPNKNILDFGESNLLLHKIAQLQRTPGLNSIVVSSDCEDMLEMARSVGAEPQLRAPEYCDEKSRTFGEVVSHIVERTAAEAVLWAPCTCPLVDEALFAKAVDAFRTMVTRDSPWDGVVSVKEFKEYLWNEHGPLNYSLGRGHVPSQALPAWQVVINGFFLATRQNMLNWEFVYGKSPYLITVPKEKSIDIDDDCDLRVARSLYRYKTLPSAAQGSILRDPDIMK